MGSRQDANLLVAWRGFLRWDCVWGFVNKLHDADADDQGHVLVDTIAASR